MAIEKSKQKFDWAIAIFAIGFLITGVASIMKVLHWQGHEYMKYTGWGIGTIGLLFVIVRSFIKSKK